MRPVVQVHTIEQWDALDQQTKTLILQNIKLKERLWKFLFMKSQVKKEPLQSPTWASCKKCGQRGWILKTPRHPGIHPSQIAKPCDLRIFNEMVGKEGREKIESRLQLIFDTGHAVHDMFQNYGAAGAWGPEYKAEVKVNGEFQKISEELMLEGSADADNILVIDDITSEGPIYEVGLIHEYKTMKAENFNKLSAPKPEHKKQATIYSAALNRPIVVYLYLNKNDQNLMDFPVPFNHEEWAIIKQRCSFLVERFKILKPPPGNTGFHCKECAYSYDCVDYKKYVNRSIPAFRSKE
jgi:CRISPR/Cas system-associated exonuclease Cas4 (RecB family)